MPLRAGPRRRDTPQLLAVLLGDADGCDSVLEILATHIDDRGFAAVTCAVDELRADFGLSADDAARLAAAFELGRRATSPSAPATITRPADVAAIAQRELSGLARETVLVIACDASNRPLRTAVIALGAVDTAILPVREILHFVLRWDGRAFAIAHNHPSGDLDAGDADIAATRRVVDAARAVGLRFLGHVVVAGQNYRPVDAVRPGRAHD